MTKEFDLNKNMSDEAISALTNIQTDLDSRDVRAISWGLTKLKLLEEQGTKIIKANYEYVEHPLHYCSGNKECIDEMIDIFGCDNVALWCDMTAYKYQYRKGKKPNTTAAEDERKAEWYLRKAKELRSNDTRRDKNDHQGADGSISEF